MSLVKIKPFITDNVANFTFGGLTITANAVFGNANLGNLATANFVSVTSNITSGNANLGNTATANYFVGNGSLLTGISATTAISLVNGNSNVVLAANSNASISIGGTGNVAVFTTTGANITGYVNATRFVGEAGNLSNIQGVNVSGAVALATSATTAGTVTTAAQPNITSLGLLANLSVNGNSSFIGNANVIGNINLSSGNANLGNSVIANYFTGNGSLLTSITGANITGYVSNANIANTAYAVAVANVIGIGNIATINKDGNASNILYGNGVFAAAPAAGSSYTNSNVATFLASYGSNTISTTGNITGGNIIGNGQALVSLTGANITGQVANALVAGTVYTAAQPNITSVGTLSSLSVTNDVTVGGNLTVNGVTTTVNSTTVVVNDINIVLANNAANASVANGAGITINGANATLLYNSTSNAFTFSHPISANGSLLTSIAGANVTGFVSNSNIANTAYAVAGANVTGAVSFATTANSVAGANVTGAVSFATTANSVAGANVSGQVANALLAGTVYTNAQPNITSVGTLTALAVTGNVTAGNITTAGASGNISGANVISANSFVGNGVALSGLTGANVTGQVGNALIAGTVYTAAQPNITSVGTLTSLSVTGNLSAGNVNAGNLLIANYHSGNGSLLTSITGANITGQVGNALVAGTVYTAAQPNITSVGTLTSLSVTGNVTAGNITTAGASGNISGANVISANTFIGNGSQLTGISASTANSVVGANVTGQVANALVAGTVYTNAQPNITSVGTLTSFTVSGVTTLGNVGNVKITGGSTGQYLKTDGTGNLSWAAVAGGGTSLTYTAATTPPGTANVADQWLNTTTNTLYEYINDGSASYWVDIQTPTVATSNANTAMNIGSFNTRSYTGTGAQVNFAITSGLNVSTVLVVQDGVVQTPTSDYTVSGTALTFTTAPANGSTIQIRELGYAVPVTSNLASVSSVLVNGTLAISTGNLTVTSNITSTSLRAQSMVMGIIFGG